MTEKEIHRLRKQDLLQLLLTQGKEAAALQEEIGRLSASLADAESSNERLREIMKVWRANRNIELEQAGSIAEAALRLNRVFETAQKAADQYLYNLKQRCEKKHE